MPSLKKITQRFKRTGDRTQGTQHFEESRGAESDLNAEENTSTSGLNNDTTCPLIAEDAALSTTTDLGPKILFEPENAIVE